MCVYTPSSVCVCACVNVLRRERGRVSFARRKQLSFCMSGLGSEGVKEYRRRRRWRMKSTAVPGEP